MTLLPDELARISARTLGHYDRWAMEFWEGTRGHDVSQNVAALLQYIEAPPPLTILDFGCGPGRDLKTFRQLGHRAIGLEGAQQLAAMARARAARAALELEGRRRAAQLEPARQRRRGLARQPLRRVLRLADVARSHDGGGLSRTDPLLPPGGPAVRAASLAGQRMAQAKH